IASRNCKPIAKSATVCCCASASVFRKPVPRANSRARDVCLSCDRFDFSGPRGITNACPRLSRRGPSDRFRANSLRISRTKIRMLGRPKFVLASGSPRRLSLLNQAGIEPDALRPGDVDETPRRGELPRACANRLARAKADAALKSVQLDDELRGSFILAADTVVAVGRRILPKANLVDEASQCLRLLSGRNHRVYTAICLVTPREAFRQRLVETRVRFKRL